MAELLVIRHAQASFGAENYDALSHRGHKQSELVGALLRERNWLPDRIVTGTLQRQAETLTSMGFAPQETRPGFDEYDFHNLLVCRFPDGVPHDVVKDRKTHFRTLRETLRMWQVGELDGVEETWMSFSIRVAQALADATRGGAQRVLVISSGGPIGRMVSATLGAPEEAMIALNLQVKNTSISRFIFNDHVRYLASFNETPHLDAPDRTDMLTYS